MNGHPIKILRLKFTNVEIDAEIADLIQLLWDCGIWTSSCCQDEYQCRPMDDPRMGKIHVQFKDSKSAKKFFNVIADYDDSADESQLQLYNAVNYGDSEFITRVNLYDRYVEPHPGCHPNFDFNVNVWFDPKYKNLVMEKLRMWSCKKKPILGISVPGQLSDVRYGKK